MTMIGGPFFWILLALGLVSVVTFFERLVDLHRAQVDYQDFLKGVINVLNANSVDEALAICEDTQSPVANVVATAIRHREGSARLLREAVDSQGRAEIGRLDRRLAALAIIAQIAPLIGLLGTVVGFVRAIQLTRADVLVARADLMACALDATLVTAMGLAVTIPVVVMYGALRVRLDRIVVDLEAAASQITGYLATRKELAK